VRIFLLKLKIDRQAQRYLIYTSIGDFHFADHHQLKGGV
jgi:hypothetical protein